MPEKDESEQQGQSELILAIERSPGSGEKIFVQKNVFKGREYVDLRIFYDASKEDGEDWRPTKKGVAIPPDILPHIIEALQKAQTLLGK